MRQCKVFVHDVEAGTLQETDDRQYIFTYQDGYAGAPVCIAMPVRTEPYRSAHLFPYFFNMLSEGANRQTQSNSCILMRTMTSVSCWRRLRRTR